MRIVRTVTLLTAFALAGAGAAAAQGTPRKTPPKVPHPVAGRAACLSCHGPDANAHVVSAPATHHFPNAACAACHHPAETQPTAVPHALDETHAQCRTCHVADSKVEGAAAPPASHESYDASTCTMCHQAAPKD